MRHHTVTATFAAPADEVFACLADIDTGLGGLFQRAATSLVE